MKKIILICICIMLALSTGMTVSAESIESPYFHSFEELNDHMNNLASHNDPFSVGLLSTFMIKTDKRYYLPIIPENFNFRGTGIGSSTISFSYNYNPAEEQGEGFHQIIVVYESISHEGKQLSNVVDSVYGPFSSVTDNQNNEVLISKDEKYFFGLIDGKYFYRGIMEGLDMDAESLVKEISFVKIPLGTSNEDLAKLIESATSVVSSEPAPVSSGPISSEASSNGQGLDTSGAPKNPDTGGLDALPVAGMAVIALGLITAGVVWRKKSKR